MCDRGVEHQTVTVHDGSRHPVVDGARRGLPGEPAAVAVELQAVGEVFCLLSGADEQHDGEELLVAFVLLLLLQNQHEVVAEARLHHHPVHGARQVDVSRQEDDVLPLQTERHKNKLLLKPTLLHVYQHLCVRCVDAMLRHKDRKASRDGLNRSTDFRSTS